MPLVTGTPEPINTQAVQGTAERGGDITPINTKSAASGDPLTPKAQSSEFVAPVWRGPQGDTAAQGNPFK
jgi:hypothetical protein